MLRHAIEFVLLKRRGRLCTQNILSADNDNRNVKAGAGAAFVSFYFFIKPDCHSVSCSQQIITLALRDETLLCLL